MCFYLVWGPWRGSWLSAAGRRVAVMADGDAVRDGLARWMEGDHECRTLGLWRGTWSPSPRSEWPGSVTLAGRGGISICVRTHIDTDHKAEPLDG